VKKTTRGAVALSAAALAVSLAGCSNYGESNNHNAPFPSAPDVKPSWTRIDDPSGYMTIMHACYGKDGIYVPHQGTTVTIVANDPECAK
jgi:hypothetical protein